MFIKSYSNLSLNPGTSHKQKKDLLSFQATTLMDQPIIILSHDALAIWIYRELKNPVDLFCGASLTGHQLNSADCAHFECTGIEFHWSYEVRGFISTSLPTANRGEYKIDIEPFSPNKIKMTHIVGPGDPSPVCCGTEVRLTQTFRQRLSLNSRNTVSTSFSVPEVQVRGNSSLSFQAKIA